MNTYTESWINTIPTAETWWNAEGDKMAAIFFNAQFEDCARNDEGCIGEEWFKLNAEHKWEWTQRVMYSSLKQYI